MFGTAASLAYLIGNRLVGNLHTKVQHYGFCGPMCGLVLRGWDRVRSNKTYLHT